MDNTPFLLWWRRFPRDVLLENGPSFQDLQARLLTVTPPTDAEALHADPLALAARLARTGAAKDLIMTWVLLAALQGDEHAGLEMALQLREQNEKLPEPDRPRASDALTDGGADHDDVSVDLDGDGTGAVDPATPLFVSDLARGWLDDMAVFFPSLLEKMGRVRRRKRIESLDIAADTAAHRDDKARDRKRPPDPRGPTLRPVKEIGDGGSRYGTGYPDRYKILTTPLPLAGGDVDPDALVEALALEFPWLDEVIGLIADDLTLQWRAGRAWFHSPPLLLAGPPGVGKTRFARRLASLAGTGMGDISAAGSSDSRALSGTARGWASAQPGLAALTMMRTGTANPVVVVDEIDKAGGSAQGGHLHATLLGLLEPETARAWPDECLLAPVDLSAISWILTANDPGRLPAPLRSRVRMVVCDTPGPDHAETLLAGLMRDLAADYGVPLDALGGLSDEAHQALTAAIGAGADARSIRNALRSALARGPATAREVMQH